MSDQLPAGPFKVLESGAPVFLIPFDKHGVCVAPQTRAHLLSTLATGGFTHIIVFSHGWNNDWSAATALYENFIQGYLKQHKDLAAKDKAAIKPLLVGIFWPSTALVLQSEEAPTMADFNAQPAWAPAVEDALWLKQATTSLAEDLPEAERERFQRLISKNAVMNAQERAELSVLIAPLLEDWDVAASDLALAAGLSAGPHTATDNEEPDDGGGTLAADPVASDPNAAFSLLQALTSPRWLLRVFTVLQMKDRAARVGGSGVSLLLRDMLQTCDAKVSMVGHSYGCIVMLSAVAAIPNDAVRRKVNSMLLLQPAVSQYCFAAHVPGKPHPGGYRVVFDRVRQPILSTYSAHDLPLTKLFHLAARRADDLGQPKIAGGAPSQYAALGGYGPAGCLATEYTDLPIPKFSAPYHIAPPGLRLVALKSDAAIKGHGDISVAETWWALHQQIHAA